MKFRLYQKKFWSSKPVFHCVSCSFWVLACFLWSPTRRPECCCIPHFLLLHPGPSHAKNRNGQLRYDQSILTVYTFFVSI